MESALKAAQWTVYGLALVIWLGSAAFAVWRNQQLITLKPVPAEGVEAATKSSMKSSHGENPSGWNVETKSRMYAATAKVRHQFLGRQYETEASQDVGASCAGLHDRLTRHWKPGAVIRVHVDPARPGAPIAGLGDNLNTFLPPYGMALFGLVIWGMGYGLVRLIPLARPWRGETQPRGPSNPHAADRTEWRRQCLNGLICLLRFV